MKLVVIALTGLAVSGCATVTRGTTAPVTVNSEPAGAQATTSLGLTCPSTPCTFEVSRKSEFVVSFSKPGYEPQQVPVATKLAGAGAAGMAGNILVGGIIGIGVDAATGATLEHFPNPVFVTLQPLGKPVSQSRRRAAPKPKRVAPAATPALEAPAS
ncbi:MAG: translation initiation factor 2 [Beijerinckiaceae bacterium]|nr:translation initiation factor 2 [Beijerinckiaceae bacterium]MBX9757779.1 translation initiation factor 2 [Beijerinckiaceae bacterium]